MLKKFMRMIQDKHSMIQAYIESGAEDIRKNNIHTLRTVSVTAFFLTLFLMFLTPVFIWKWNISIFHIELLIMMFAFAMISEALIRDENYKPWVERTVIISFLITLMALFTALDTVDSPNSAETFMIGFLIIAPILFVIPIGPMIAAQVLYTAAFMLAVYIYKDARMFGGDCFQAIYGAAVGMVLYCVVMRLRLLEFHQKSIYKISSEVDFLTQINNRATSKRKIDQYLEMKAAEDSCAMIILDVDRFKEVNDKLGHEKGDEVLREVAEILKKEFRGGDVVGRFGGDEFIVFMKDLDHADVVDRKCSDILEEMHRVLDGKFQISCSMGVCYMKQEHATNEELFRVADEALYEAKTFGKDTFVRHEFVRNTKTKEELPLMVIVDDSEVDREVLALQFEGKYQMQKFADSEVAYQYVVQHAQDISIILLDMIMPGVDGFEILHRIKSKPEIGWLPVVAVSSDSCMEEKALEYGAEEMIIKPIVPAVTRLRVANVMKNRKK